MQQVLYRHPMRNYIQERPFTPKDNVSNVYQRQDASKCPKVLPTSLFTSGNAATTISNDESGALGGNTWLG